MIEFNIEKKKMLVKINDVEREIEFTTITPLTKAEFQAKMLDSDSVTIGNLQNNDAKVNLDVITKKDLYLFAYVVKKIQDEERWESWSFNKKLEWVQNFAGARAKEFEEAIEKLKKETGDLI